MSHNFAVFLQDGKVHFKFQYTRLKDMFQQRNNLQLRVHSVTAL